MEALCTDFKVVCTKRNLSFHSMSPTAEAPCVFVSLELTEVPRAFTPWGLVADQAPATPVASIPPPVARGPELETLGSGALVSAETSYLDALKPQTRSDIKPERRCRQQPCKGLGENVPVRGGGCPARAHPASSPSPVQFVSVRVLNAARPAGALHGYGCSLSAGRWLWASAVEPVGKCPLGFC